MAWKVTITAGTKVLEEREFPNALDGSMWGTSAAAVLQKRYKTPVRWAIEQRRGKTTTSERVAKMRRNRAALGLTRIEVYVHPEDHHHIKTLAAKLAEKRTHV